MIHSKPYDDFMPEIPEPTPIQVALKAWHQADAAWSAELVKEFGKQAGDARYFAKGRSTPRLRELAEAFNKAQDAYYKLRNERDN